MTSGKSISGLYQLVTIRCNNFILPGSSQNECVRFLVQGSHVGFIRPDMLSHLKNYPDVFYEKVDEASREMYVELNPTLKSFQERSDAVRAVMTDLRKKDVLSVLRGWRNEDYGVYRNSRQEMLLRMERSACSILGVTKYGVHINGYSVVDSSGNDTIVHPDQPDRISTSMMNKSKNIRMWISKRSSTKQTWPGYMDNLAAGGLNVDLGILECARKECQEEASVPESLLNRLTPVGTVSYLFEDERGVMPQIEYCFDLQLPIDFIPENSDGEVEAFKSVSMSEVKELIQLPDFKPNSAMAVLDFLYRHGCMNPDEDDQYALLKEWMHSRMPFE